jgi:hypothetical protein
VPKPPRRLELDEGSVQRLSALVVGGAARELKQGAAESRAVLGDLGLEGHRLAKRGHGTTEILRVHREHTTRVLKHRRTFGGRRERLQEPACLVELAALGEGARSWQGFIQALDG